MAAEDDVALLIDAARVHKVSLRVRNALAELAVRPLSESAADQMRAALSGAASARGSLDRLRESSAQSEERYEQ